VSPNEAREQAVLRAIARGGLDPRTVQRLEAELAELRTTDEARRTVRESMVAPHQPRWRVVDPY
jgi:hypothetical protein